jgi:hypothetical protein
MADQQAPTNNLAVLGFCELVGLMFGLPPIEALYRGEPVSVRMVLFATIGIAFAVVGPSWPLLKGKLPRRFAATFVRTASEFQWWMLVLLAFFASQVFSVTDQNTPNVVETVAQNIPSPPPVAASPSATPAPVYLNVGPLYFAGIVKHRTDAQVQALVKPYLGKWMRITGKVEDVETFPAGMPDQRRIVLEFGPDANKTVVQAVFDESWTDRVSQLNAGDRVSVTGSLATVYQDGSFVLEECKFELQ